MGYGDDRNIKVVLGGDSKGAESAFDKTERGAKSLSDQTNYLEKDVRRLSGTLSTFMGAAGLAGISLVARDAVRGFIESENASRQLEQRLRSTGGVAGLTSQELQKYAETLQKTTIFEDDATVAAETLLLTFTKIQGPIFKEAIASIQDMSVALGQDLNSSTIQVGKALNDPIAGMTALRRAGVSFTEDQREQIKTLVESGRVMDAQKVILRELQTEFGGAATAAKETLGGALTSLKNEFGNVLENLVGAGIGGGGVVGGINSLTEALGKIDVEQAERFLKVLEGIAVGLSTKYAIALSLATVRKIAFSASTLTATTRVGMFGETITLAAARVGIAEAAITALGGPLGILTGLVIAGATAWTIYGDDVKKAAKEIRDVRDVANFGEGSISTTGGAGTFKPAGGEKFSLSDTERGRLLAYSKGSRLPKTGSDSNGDGSHKPTKKGLTEDQRIALEEGKAQIKEFYKYAYDTAETEDTASRIGITLGEGLLKKTSLTIQEKGGLFSFLTNESGRPENMLGNVDLLGSAIASQEAADKVKKFAEKRTQLERETQANISQIEAETLQSRLSYLGQDEQALDAYYVTKKTKMDQDYLNSIMHAQDVGADTSLIRQQYMLEEIQMEEEKAQRLAGIWWNNSQTYVNFAQQMTTMGLQYLFFEEQQKGQIGKRMLATSLRFLTQGLQQFMFSKAKEHLIAAFSHQGQTAMMSMQHVASLTMLETEAVAWAAFLSALAANPYGGEVVIPAATAMSAVATGVVPGAIAAVGTETAGFSWGEVGMAAAWAAGGIAVGALGEAGATAIEGGTSGATTAAGYGGGSYGSPVVTQPAATQQAGPGDVHIHIHGNVYQQDKWVEDYLVPTLRDLHGRNVTITTD
jgi:hypothetical protein